MDKNQGICQQYQNGYCKYGSHCRYIHQKKQECRYYQMGHCKLGSQCLFLHTKKQDSTQQQQQQQKKSKQQQQQLDEQVQDKPVHQEQLQKQVQNQSYQEEKKNSEVSQMASTSTCVSQEVATTIKYKQQKFIDVTKSEEAMQIFDKNEQFFQQNNGYNSYVRSLKNPNDVDIAQIMRRFQHSFQWVDRNISNCRVCQLKMSPTINSIDVKIDIEIVEGFFWFEIIIPDDLPKSHASFLMINTGVNAAFKRALENELLNIHVKQHNNIFKTLRYFDNQLDNVCQLTIEAVRRNEKLQQIQLQKQQIEEKLPPLQRETNKDFEVQDFDKKRLETEILEKVIKPWSQEEQTSLEKAIVQCKQIIDKDEKWQAITKIVCSRDKDECIARFQYCRQLSLAKQQLQINPPIKEETKLDAEDNEEEDEDDNDDDNEDEDPYEGQEVESLSDLEEEDYDEEDEEKQERDGGLKLEIDLNVTITLRDVDMRGAQLCRLLFVILKVKCINCKYETERTVANVHPQDQNILINDILCESCNNAAQIYCRREFIHLNNLDASVIARVGSFTWSIVEVQSASYELTCSACNGQIKIVSFISGQRLQDKCFQCFQDWIFQYSGTAVERREVLPAYKKKRKVNQDKEGQDDLTLGIRKKRIGIFKQGVPLPNNGVCSHYKHSNRYFRFPCCGKAYPCDICHDTKESGHEPLLAKAMICGFCGVEQSVKSECSRCGKMVTRAVKKMGHWEGGKGVRDKGTMNKGDTHKYKGQNKTVSKKKIKNQQQQK